MKQPPAGKKPEATDAGILWYGIDRTERQKTGEARVPKGKLPDIRSSLAEFGNFAKPFANMRRRQQKIRDRACCSKETWTCISGC